MRGWVRLAMVTLMATACGKQTTEPPAPAWDRMQAPATAIGERRGLVPARTIVHLHSPYSHDACDGRPRIDETGPIDESCLTDLREALCAARIDVAALTDHDGSMADEEWGPNLFLYREGDELVLDADRVIANYMTCADGHRTMIRIGSENTLMPVFMESHPEGDVGVRKSIYNGADSATVTALREAGATIWVAHTEQHDVDWLRELGVDGFELFNIHAAIAPDIRKDHLGIDPTAAIESALEFNLPDDNMPEPDLAGIAVMFANEPARRAWTTLLSEGRKITVTAGTDAHQNALANEMSDGERADSYRRMIRWASNILLVRDPSDPMAVEAALLAGQSFLAFELFGTPAGFDFYVTPKSGAPLEMGGEIAVSDAASLVVTPPTVSGLWSGAPAPTITAVVVRVDQDGQTEIARGEGRIDIAIDSPGAYHTRIEITPSHLAPYFGWLASYAEQSYTWVQSNAIYVRP